MQVKNYISIAIIATIKDNAIFELMRIGHYYSIFYMYPTRTRVIKYKNLIEACEDFVKRMQFLAKTYKVEFTEKGDLFVRNPNAILL